jgi:hypothetical protein
MDHATASEPRELGRHDLSRSRLRRWRFGTAAERSATSARSWGQAPARCRCRTPRARTRRSGPSSCCTRLRRRKRSLRARLASRASGDLAQDHQGLAGLPRLRKARRLFAAGRRLRHRDPPRAASCGGFVAALDPTSLSHAHRSRGAVDVIDQWSSPVLRSAPRQARRPDEHRERREHHARPERAGAETIQYALCCAWSAGGASRSEGVSIISKTISSWPDGIRGRG